MGSKRQTATVITSDRVCVTDLTARQRTGILWSAGGPVQVYLTDAVAGRKVRVIALEDRPGVGRGEAMIVSWDDLYPAPALQGRAPRRRRRRARKRAPGTRERRATPQTATSEPSKIKQQTVDLACVQCGKGFSGFAGQLECGTCRTDR